MKKMQHFHLGCVLIALFALWSLLIQTVDVQSAGETGTALGFATFNCWFHKFTGVHMGIYLVTDWLGLIPLFVCILFGALGLSQWICRKSIRKVDPDLLLLGGYYMLVMFAYLIFEEFPLNYRPILIDGRMEASYPSSTTLLVLSVMPTLVFQIKRRMKNEKIKNRIIRLCMVFSSLMVIGRLISGVHWFTDIVGSILLSTGLFQIYRAAVLFCCKKTD